MLRVSRKVFLGLSVILWMISCRTINKSSLEDISDGKYRLGRSQYVESVQYVGYHLMLCTDEDVRSAGFKPENDCVNPFLMYWPQESRWVRSSFVDIPKNRQQMILDNMVIRESSRIAREEKGYISAIEDGKKDVEIFNRSIDRMDKLIVQSKDRYSMLQTELEKLEPDAINKYQVDKSALQPTAIDPVQKVIVLARAPINYDRKEQIATDPVKGRVVTCDCFNSPSRFYLSKNLVSCSQLSYDPPDCRYNYDKKDAKTGPRCFCLSRSGPQGRATNAQVLFDPGANVACQTVADDPIDQCFDPATVARFQFESEKIALIKKIKSLKLDLLKLDQTVATSQIAAKAAAANRENTLKAIDGTQQKLENLQREPRERDAIIASKFGDVEQETAKMFDKIMGGGWRTDPEAKASSVPKLLKQLATLYNLRFNCRVGEKFPDLKSALAVPDCLPDSEGEKIFRNALGQFERPGDAVDITPRPGLYVHPTLQYLYLKSVEQNKSLQSVQFDRTKFQGPSISSSFDVCKDGVCSSQDALGLTFVALGPEKFRLVNSAGEGFDFRFAETSIKPGVYRDVRKAAQLIKPDPATAATAENPYGSDFRIQVGRDQFFSISICGLSSSKASLIQSKFDCQGGIRCIDPVYPTNFIDIKSSDKFSLTLGRVINFEYLGEIGVVEDDCDPAKVIKPKETEPVKGPAPVTPGTPPSTIFAPPPTIAPVPPTQN